ncbi:hypothetical protein O181_000697 [Austropuccinia psidii MF-1]|uniref:Uncharacterized protein n=1 Tax=Austropuccinia psidii MF-1 TaxID=1389203 RepID=A0A9Q3B9D5_9BASI|nr:hypothetical protein [Austropuccinia psidii MF-1]
MSNCPFVAFSGLLATPTLSVKSWPQPPFMAHGPYAESPGPFGHFNHPFPPVHAALIEPGGSSQPPRGLWILLPSSDSLDYPKLLWGLGAFRPPMASTHQGNFYVTG